MLTNIFESVSSVFSVFLCISLYVPLAVCSRLKGYALGRWCGRAGLCSIVMDQGCAGGYAWVVCLLGGLRGLFGIHVDSGKLRERRLRFPARRLYLGAL